MNKILLLLYGLEALAGIFLILILLLSLRTPAWTFLKAWIKRKPVTLMIRRDGSGYLTLPERIEEGIAYFRRGKRKLGYFITRASMLYVPPFRLGIALENRGAYIPLHCFYAAKKLRENGFKNYTEAEIAYLIRQIEKEKNMKFDLDSEIKIKEGKKEYLVPAVDYLTEELRRRGLNPFLDPQEDIQKVLEEKKQERIGNCEDDFTIIADFFKYNINPNIVEDRLAIERQIARDMSLLGGGKLNYQTAIFIFIVLIAIATFVLILTQTGVVDSITKMFKK